MFLEKNPKIKNNAISAYFLFFICILFLFNRNNPFINNDFVKKHAKSAFLVHFLIFLSILIFYYFKILWAYFIFWFNLNFLFWTSLLLILFSTLIFWMYKANRWEYFSIWDIFKFDKDKKILDINKDWNFWEKDKLTLILGFIPFLWPILVSKYSKNIYINEILKLNTLVTFIICLLFIKLFSNLSQILLLFYLIFVAFVGVNLFLKWELLTINLPKYLSFSEFWKNFKIFFIYMKKYLTWNFEEFSILKEKYEKENYKKDLIYYEKIKNLPDLKWPKKIIYLPFINFIFLFFKENKYKIHIINGLVISFLAIFLIILIFFKIYSIKILILLLFPISFGIWNLWKIFYKMPFIYDIYEFFSFVLIKLKFFKKTIWEKRKEVKEEKFVVWQKNMAPKTEEITENKIPEIKTEKK